MFSLDQCVGLFVSSLFQPLCLQHLLSQVALYDAFEAIGTTTGWKMRIQATCDHLVDIVQQKLRNKI